MTSFREVAVTRMGFCILTAILLLMILWLYLFVRTPENENRRLRAAALAELVWIFCAILLLMDAIFPGAMIWRPRRSWPFLVEKAASLPYVIWLFAIIGSLCHFCLYLKAIRLLESTQFSQDTIKETLDLLPAGICIGDAGGKVVMANAAMTDYYRQFTGGLLLSIHSLREEILRRGTKRDDSYLIRMDDGKVLRFDMQRIMADGRECDQYLAFDVTEQMVIVDRLAEDNARLRDIQYRMKAYSVRAAEMFMEQEILAARVAVHDGLGDLLLTCRYFFENPETTDREGLLRMMKETNTYLLREAEEPRAERDHYMDALRMARGIGVTVHVEGQVPGEGAARRIIGLAVSECAANTVKHAGGDTVTVRIDGERIEITNNGTPPEGPIVETGGLRSLRRMTEEIGGEMQVAWEGGFRLTIRVPDADFRDLPIVH